MSGKNQAPGPKHSKDNPEKLERQTSRMGIRSVSFHRRDPLSEDLSQFDMSGILIPQTTQQTSAGSGGATVNFNTTSSTTPANPGTLPHLNSSNEAVSVESLSPAAPSPLEDPNSQANHQAVDPTMPKLSPHPPAEDSGEKDGVPVVSASGANKGNINNNASQKVVANIIGQIEKNTVKPVDTAQPNNIVTDTPSFTTTQQKIVSDISAFSPNTSNWTSTQMEAAARNASTTNWITSQQRLTDVSLLKRPVLASKESEEDELVTKSLYAFDQVNFW